MFTGLMVDTWAAATAVAVVAGVVGFFAVLRGSTFAAHAIPNGAFAGAAGAALIGLSPILGLGVFAIGGALAIASSRRRHDVVTALALAMMLALGAFFLTASTEYAPQAYSLLFGEVFGVGGGELLPIIALAVLTLAAMALLFRPLLLSSVMPEVAEARGLGGRRMEAGFLLVMALATSLSVPVVGTLLMFSLMIGPAAAARSLTARPLLAVALSIVLALATVWAGIAVSYQTGWPLGFFVGVGGALVYLAGRSWSARRSRTRRPGKGVDRRWPGADAIGSGSEPG